MGDMKTDKHSLEGWGLFVFVVSRQDAQQTSLRSVRRRRCCVVAPGRDAALLGLGLYRDELASPTQAMPWERLQGFSRLGARELADFYEVLGASLRTGSPVLHALRLAARQATSARMRGLVGSLAKAVAAGCELHEALARHQGLVPAGQVALARAASQSGLAHAGPLYRRLGRRLARDARLAGKIQAALAYPVLLLVMAVAASLILEFKALPPMVELFRSMGAELPFVTRLFYGAARVLSEQWLLLLPGAAALLVLLPMLLRRLTASPGFQIALLRIPGLGPVLLSRALSRALGIFCLLRRSGCVNRELFSHAAAAAGNRGVELFFHAANARVQAGRSLEEAFAAERHRLGVAGVRLAGKLELGLDSGELDSLLEEFVDELEDEADTRAALLPRLLEIPMLLLCGLVIGAILLAMFLPYPSLLGDIARQMRP